MTTRMSVVMRKEDVCVCVCLKHYYKVITMTTYKLYFNHNAVTMAMTLIFLHRFHGY